MIAHGAPQICRGKEFWNMLCTRTILGLSSKRLNLCSLTSTKSLPTKTYVTSVGPIAAVRVKLSRLAAEYNQSYTIAMKTAISIPDAIFEEAERLAKIRGWSRSELYSNAVSAYVNSERFLGVREKLDAVYGQNVDDSAVDPLLAKAQARSLPKEKW